MKTGQYFLTIPASIVKAKGWKKADKIEVIIDNKGEIVLRR